MCFLTCPNQISADEISFSTPYRSTPLLSMSDVLTHLKKTTMSLVKWGNIETKQEGTEKEKDMQGAD